MNEDLLKYFFVTLPHFLAYFGTAVILAAAYLSSYVAITPHKEFQLIRAGNGAAATQLVGSFLGFAIPLAIVIGHSVSILDVVIWGVVVLIVQVAVFLVIAQLFRGIEKRIEEDCQSSGVFIGGLALGVGILQAACMVP